MRDTGNNDEANANIDNNENTSVGRARGFPSIGVMVMVIITMEMIRRGHRPRRLGGYLKYPPPNPPPCSASGGTMRFLRPFSTPPPGFA